MEKGGGTQGDKVAGPPPQERRTSGRSATRPLAPPTARRSGSEGKTREQQKRRGCGEGAPPQLGRKGMPEEQAQAIVAHKVNLPLGRDPPRGQALVPCIQQSQPTRGSRGQGSRVRRNGGRGGEGRRDTGGQGSRTSPQEGRTSGRSATRPLRVGQKCRWRRTRRTTRKGGGEERPQGRYGQRWSAWGGMSPPPLERPRA